MASPILDPFGYPIYSSGGGRLIEGARNDPKKGPALPLVTEGIGRSVSYWDWRVVLSSSRKLWANFGVLKGATAAKGMHAIGRAWEPEFQGQDKEWGKLATEFLFSWYQNCDVRGEPFDFKTGLYLDSISTDRDGDFGCLLTQSEAGWPQLQRIGAHRIGMRSGGDQIVGDNVVSLIENKDGELIEAKGVYRGMRIQHGMIFNSRGRAVAARIIGATPADDRDVSMQDFIHRFDPEWYDQARGFSCFSGSLDFIRSSFFSHDWQQRALLIASAIGLIEHNEGGAGDPNDPGYVAGNSDPTAGQTTFSTQEMEGGLIRYFRAGSGSKLESFVDGKPGDQWSDFNDRIIRIALCEMNWPYSLVWKPEGMNGTQERSAIEQARASISDRQDLVRPFAKRAVGYAISKAIKLGILPPYKGPDIGGQLNWAFSLPPLFNIDHGREDDQWRKNYLLGVETMAGKLRQDGKRADVFEHFLIRAREQAMKQKAIAQAEAEFGVTIDPREVQMFGPNDQAGGEADDSSDNPEAPEKPTKKKILRYEVPTYY